MNSNLDPTFANHHKIRDANATDLQRQAEQRERRARREYAIEANAPSAAQLGHAWGVCVPLIERLLRAEAEIKQLHEHLAFLIEKKIHETE